MKRVRFASAMRATGGRHSSLMVLQRLVVRSRAALGRGPGDDGVWVLDVAGLAVHAVGGVDLQAPPAVASSTISYTPAGQKRSQGWPYSLPQRCAQIEVSATFRCTG